MKKVKRIHPEKEAVRKFKMLMKKKKMSADDIETILRASTVTITITIDILRNKAQIDFEEVFPSVEEVKEVRKENLYECEDLAKKY